MLQHCQQSAPVRIMHLAIQRRRPPGNLVHLHVRVLNQHVGELVGVEGATNGCLSIVASWCMHGSHVTRPDDVRRHFSMATSVVGFTLFKPWVVHA